MPVLPSQTAKVSPDPYRASDVNLDQSVAEGISDVGTAISNSAERVRREAEIQQERDRRKEEQSAWIRLQGLNEELSQDLTVIDRDAPADGSGIADTFSEKALTPKTDAFLGTIKDQRVREEYAERLKVAREKWENDAINKEYDRGNAHSLNVLSDAQAEKARGIATDPTNFESWVLDFEKMIDDAPNITTVQKEEIRRKWRQTAPAILSEQLKISDPETLYYASGHGKADERRAYVSKAVVAAVAYAETAGGVDLVSDKGALGRMQIMPDTAIEIAQDLGDRHFLSLDAEGRERYLLTESVSYRYGEHYLNKMLKQNNGNLTLALIAYNAGQKRADEFVNKGGDWSKMGAWSKETQPYVDKIIGMLGTKRFAANVGIPRKPGAPGLGSGAKLPAKFEDAPGRAPVDRDTSHLDKGLLEKWELVQGAIGRQLPIVSGFRSPDVNEAAGGADQSRHTHGDAIDIDVRGLSKEQRLELVRTASAAGFTGIGIYNTSIHLDTRQARKSWGPNHSQSSVPEWARSTINQHLAGVFGEGAGTTLATGSGGAGRPGAAADEESFLFEGFQDLSANNLLQVRSEGVQGVKKKTDAEKLALETLKARSKMAAENDVASMLQTGKGSILPGDIEQFQQDLLASDGPQAVMDWARDRARAQTIFAMTDGIEAMSSSQLDAVVDQKPSGGKTAADQQYVHEEVVKLVDAEKKRRSDDPGLAIQTHPDLQAELKAFDTKDADSTQNYFDKAVALQRQLGMEVSLLPKAKAEQLGQQIRTIIKMNPDQQPDDLTKSFLKDLEAKFGGYADEVFMQSLETVLDKHISRETRDIMSTTLLEWIKTTPGANDPNYRRLKNKYNWSYAPEFAAQDKVKLEAEEQDPFAMTIPAQLGARAGQATRDFLGNLFTRTPQQPTQPGSLSTLRPATRVKGVPDAALDQLTTMPNDPKVQSAFRKQFGEDAFREAQKMLKQGVSP